MLRVLSHERRSWILGASLGRAAVEEVHPLGAREVLAVYIQGGVPSVHDQASSPE